MLTSSHYYYIMTTSTDMLSFSVFLHASPNDFNTAVTPVWPWSKIAVT